MEKINTLRIAAGVDFSDSNNKRFGKQRKYFPYRMLKH